MRERGRKQGRGRAYSALVGIKVDRFRLLG